MEDIVQPIVEDEDPLSSTRNDYEVKPKKPKKDTKEDGSQAVLKYLEAKHASEVEERRHKLESDERQRQADFMEQRGQREADERQRKTEFDALQQQREADREERRNQMRLDERRLALEEKRHEDIMKMLVGALAKK